jgi:hypothetical protein
MGRRDDRAGYQTVRPRSATQVLGLEIAEIGVRMSACC